MSDNAVIMAWMLVTLIGVVTVAVVIGNGLVALVSWYCRRRGWLPEREIVVRMPMNSRVTLFERKEEKGDA
ncbi:hypothetical protein SAMN04244548_01198 [Paracoccus pantotrophus]|nr:hypothetical protein SAMN04244548_01198 [Paracoccus pantotrophus]